MSDGLLISIYICIYIHIYIYGVLIVLGNPATVHI